MLLKISALIIILHIFKYYWCFFYNILFVGLSLWPRSPLQYAVACDDFHDYLCKQGSHARVDKNSHEGLRSKFGTSVS